jgi:hypothetical protein
MTYSPSINLVPKPLHFRNLRKILTQTQWDKIRKPLIAEHGNKCQVCKEDVKQVYAHEEWEYDTAPTPAVSRFAGITLSCWHCHAVEHFLNTGLLVRSGSLTQQALDDTVAHFCRLNGVGPKEFEAHLAEAYAKWENLSALEWVIDWGPYAAMVAEREAKRAAKG